MSWRSRQRTAATKPLDDQGSTLIKVNPVQFKVPRPATKHVYVIATREQVQALADAMPPNLALGVLLAGTLGLRQGEVLGLQRRDIELDASPALLHVRRSAKEVSENGHKVSILGETKTPSSKRDIEVPAPWPARFENISPPMWTRNRPRCCSPASALAAQ
ncbi:integrase [Bifidobacterium breve]|uniref:integrase n=1 Tax=Bifidobacterium breve TaxID=1685 RepID=UPI0030F3C928